MPMNHKEESSLSQQKSLAVSFHIWIKAREPNLQIFLILD